MTERVYKCPFCALDWDGISLRSEMEKGEGDIECPRCWVESPAARWRAPFENLAVWDEEEEA